MTVGGKYTCLPRSKMGTSSSRTVMESRSYAQQELDSMWDEYRRPIQPHIYKVDLSDQLYDLKKRLIEQFSGERA